MARRVKAAKQLTFTNMGMTVYKGNAGKARPFTTAEQCRLDACIARMALYYPTHLRSNWTVDKHHIARDVILAAARCSSDDKLMTIAGGRRVETLIEGEWWLFAKWMESLLRSMHTWHNGMGFATIAHDEWTGPSGESISGATIHFRDCQFRAKNIALLLSDASNIRHTAKNLSSVLKVRFARTYGLPLQPLLSGCMSDAAANALKGSSFLLAPDEGGGEIDDACEDDVFTTTVVITTKDSLGVQITDGTDGRVFVTQGRTDRMILTGDCIVSIAAATSESPTAVKQPSSCWKITSAQHLTNLMKDDEVRAPLSIRIERQSRVDKESHVYKCEMHRVDKLAAFAVGLIEKSRQHRIVSIGGKFSAGAKLVQRHRRQCSVFSRCSNRAALLKQSQQGLGMPMRKMIMNGQTRVSSVRAMFARALLNRHVLLYLGSGQRAHGCCALDVCYRDRLLTRDEWMLTAELEALLRPIAELAKRVQEEDQIIDSMSFVLKRQLLHNLASQWGAVLVVDVDAPTYPSSMTESQMPCTKRRFDDFSAAGKQAWVRLLWAINSWFPRPTDAELLALSMDPRTRPDGTLNALLGANYRALIAVARATLASSVEERPESPAIVSTRRTRTGLRSQTSATNRIGDAEATPQAETVTSQRVDTTRSEKADEALVDFAARAKQLRAELFDNIVRASCLAERKKQEEDQRAAAALAVAESDDGSSTGSSVDSACDLRPGVRDECSADPSRIFADESVLGIDNVGKSSCRAPTTGDRRRRDESFELEIHAKAQRTLTQYLNTEFCVHKYVTMKDTENNAWAKGRRKIPLVAMFDHNINISPWVVQLRDVQPFAFRALQLSIGAMKASSFVERLFSTSKHVWNDRTNCMLPSKYEKWAILRQNVGLMPDIRASRAAASSPSCSSLESR